jgi:hypothetical protein
MHGALQSVNGGEGEKPGDDLNSSANIKKTCYSSETSLHFSSQKDFTRTQMVQKWKIKPVWQMKSRICHTGF